jgi:hypothetical protein
VIPLVSVSVTTPGDGVEQGRGWPTVAERIVAAAAQWKHEAVTKQRLTGLLAEANDILRQEAELTRALMGWGIRYFVSSPFVEVWDALLASNEVTLIAVDSRGIGHDIAALAAGEYNDR